MIITSLWTVDLLILLTTITFLLYKYSIRKYDYFKKRNVRYAKPIPFFGSMFAVFSMKRTIGEWLQELYDTIDEPYFGIFVFDEPYLIIKSPELIKDVLVKNFHKFTDRTILAPKHNTIISNMLFMQKSPDWKMTRPKISPIFSSGKLKLMFSTINEVGDELNRYIQKNLGTLDAKGVTAKYATDVIAKCAFAINSYSFENENSEFSQVGRSLFDFSWRNGLIQSSYFFRQNLASRLHLDFFEKWATDTLKDIFWNAIRKREESSSKGNDLIEILVEMRKNKDLCKELKFDGDKVVAQAVQFFAAGYETTSATISFTLYELCLQPDLQDKLRHEILDTIKLHDGITYQALKEMKYLEMCIFESLRKYPVLPYLDRRCNEDHLLPGTDLIIEEGISVYIPMLGLHYDEKFYPEPEKYDPERFSDRKAYNKNGLEYIPFGEGPRICIGERFGMLGVKIALAHVLSKFVLERVPETPVPVQFEPKSLLLQSTVGLPIRFKKFEPTPI